jgi:catechol 2,3-dioxygenase-like lactoylglutathione lyase family enzyme
MLGNSRVHPVLLATNLAEAREFYHDKIGLEIIAESDDKRSSSAAVAAPSWPSRRAPLGPPTARPRSAGRSTTFGGSSMSSGPAG